MAYARANMFYERESWRKPLALSLGFHALVVLSIVVLGYVMAPRVTSNWGENQGEAVEAKLVSAAPIPLPRPEEQTQNIVANESKGVTQSVPQPKPVETEDGITIPGHVVKPKTEKTVTATDIKPRPVPAPTTAVPYGESGPVSGPYGVFSAPNTKGGFSLQDASMGNKYGWYLDVVRRKVQDNWLAYEIDPHVTAPHRAYIDFDILRDGTISNIKMVQSSGIPTLDQSALRALQRVDTFGKLPEGSKLSVEFWFDYPAK